jgi:hypothetical protein
LTAGLGKGAQALSTFSEPKLLTRAQGLTFLMTVFGYNFVSTTNL